MGRYAKQLTELAVRAVVDGYACGQSGHDAVKLGKTVLGIGGEMPKPKPVATLVMTPSAMNRLAGLLDAFAAASAVVATAAAEQAASERLADMRRDAEMTLQLANGQADGGGMRTPEQVDRARRTLDALSAVGPFVAAHDDERIKNMSRPR
jgi:hypothetical protein